MPFRTTYVAGILLAVGAWPAGELMASPTLPNHQNPNSGFRPQFGADSDRNRSRIASRLFSIAHDLRISSIAQGVETPSELEWAQNHGVDYVQGYYIAHPASPPPVPVLGN